MLSQSMADSFWYIVYCVDVGLVSDELEVFGGEWS